MAPAPALDCVEGEKKPVKPEHKETPEMKNAVELLVQPEKKDNMENEELDVVNCYGSAADPLINDDGYDPDATECSSSFGNTFSGSDCDSKRDLDEMEVSSPLFVPDDSHVAPDGLNGSVKKKNVTAHWRKYIVSTRWRCLWLELRMRDLRSQLSMYEKELASYKHEKDVQSKMVELNSSASRTVPMAFQGHPKGKMRRSKRRRDEDKINLCTYESNHVIFSYNEDKKLENQLVVSDDSGDEVKKVDFDWLFNAIRSDANVYEILLKIEILRSKVSELKANLNKVITQNTMENSMYPVDCLPGYLPESYAHSASVSPINRDTAAELCTSPHNVSEYETEADAMTDCSVSSYGDAADPYATDGSFSLSCIHDLLSQQHILDLSKNDEDDILIDNHHADLDFRLDHTVETAPVPVKEHEIHPRVESSAPLVSLPEEGTSKTVIASEQASLKPCYSGEKRGRKPKKKRRGRPAAASDPVKLKRGRPPKRQKLGKRT